MQTQDFENKNVTIFYSRWTKHLLLLFFFCFSFFQDQQATLDKRNDKKCRFSNLRIKLLKLKFC